MAKVLSYSCGLSTATIEYSRSSDQGQGHSVKFVSIYHNTNCQVLYLSFGTC